MKPLLILFTLLLITHSAEADNTTKVAAVLDALHAAASHSESEAYFDLFSDEAIFIGTDVGEYWTLGQFKSYAMPSFKKGRGWTYIPRSRNIQFSNTGEMAWFHEILDNEHYGTTRGTGVLILEKGKGWRIVQYHLTIPIPNDIATDLTDRIKSYEAAPGSHKGNPEE